ncbi:hypothetical protein [Methylopila sp. Yamaguchi]|uniref:hypothetical protein n=1 Tax=Methylopila sp. Yamaguchi TaxID=1437817 RepID=UPI000CB9107C|nr:hypothetical protein [Methylopila sp. Yamaguchi]GBD48095.1 hypothetical protein METY_1308 [Methylopila sp. Yamaguchi]
MLTVVESATSRRLTTVEHVRMDLGLGSQTPSDAQVERFIDQASAAAERFCRRTFARETVLQTIRACDLNRALLLERGPVSSVETVTWNGSAISSADYETDRGFLWRLSAASGRRMFWGGSVLAVRYVAGYVLPGETGADLPADVERAVIQLVGAALSTQGRDPLVKSEDVDGVGEITFWVPGARSQLASPEAETLLRPYRLARVR